MICYLLNHLKKAGNPYYNKLNVDMPDYIKRLERINISEEAEERIEEEVQASNEEKEAEEAAKERAQEEAEEEENYVKNDPVRKYQPKDYDENIVLCNMYPDLGRREENDGCVTVAPGEGNTPSSALYEKDFDVKTFPLLSNANGTNGIHQERGVKLTEQNYIVQRLQNVNERYVRSTDWTFSMSSYIEEKQLSRNIAMEGKRGKKVTGAEGKMSLKMQDEFAVLDDIKGTPRYWSKVKNEAYAKLDNHGSFHIFFTLSCGDTRWISNLVTILAKKGMLVEVEVVDGESVVYVKEDKEGSEWMSLDQYMEESPDSLNKHIKKNIYTMARHFNQRVQAFITEIVMGKNNPIPVLHWSYKTEFQARGAAHVHGLLWLNMDVVEEYCQTEDGELVTEEQIEKVAGLKEKLKKSDEEIEALKKSKPFRGIKSAYRKIKDNKELDKEELDAMARFTDSIVTVSKCPAEIEQMCKGIDGRKVVQMVEDVNTHHHTKTCKKKDKTKCRFNFKRFPCWKTIIARPPKQTKEGDEETEEEESERMAERKSLREQSERTLNKVREVMDCDELIEEIMAMHPKSLDDTVEENSRGRKARILELLNIADVTEEEYIEALEYSPKGYTVVLRRDIDEMMVNNYNPEWIINWDANIDIQPVKDFFGAITYVTEYWAKDESKTLAKIQEAVKESKDMEYKEKMKTVAGVWQKSRQVGEVESFYKIDPHLRLKNSDSTCRWLSLEDPTKGHTRMRRAEEGAQQSEKNIELEGHKGLWVEQPDTLSKYMRMKTRSEDPKIDPEEADPADISLAQMAKMYAPCNSPKRRGGQQDNIDQYRNNQWKDLDPVDEECEEDFVEDEYRFEKHGDPDRKFQFLMCPDGQEKKPLPEIIRLNDLRPGEPGFLKLRTKPVSLRWKKVNQRTEPHEYFRKEIMLYHAGWDENLFKLTDDETFNMYKEKEVSIRKVKSQVMEHLESVEEARIFVRMQEEKLNLEDTALAMDAENEQDNAENEGIEEEDQELSHLNQDVEESKDKEKTGSIFPSIDVSEEVREKLEEKTQRLDKWQTVVLCMAIGFAKDCRRAEINGKRMPKPRNLMVHGGAGSGKSAVIDVLTQWVERFSRKAGDRADQPYVIRTAPTGAAACLIDGTTLHSAFGFDFSGKFTTLTGKKKVDKIQEMKNLRFVIVDEVSMMPADMLYNLNLRLQEVKENDELFGGVMLICFGDLMQIRPVKQRWVFEAPAMGGEDLVTAHELDPLWEKLEVVNLEENHRQGEDKEYADLLLRARVGELLKEDEKVLQGRVRSEDHEDYVNADLYIECTNAEVAEMNKMFLKKIEGESIKMTASHYKLDQKNFKPTINKQTGEIGKTGFHHELEVKIGCKVMLNTNLDIGDGLVNGQMGKLRGVVRGPGGEVETLMVKFNMESAGQKWRSRNPGLASRYPGCTGIKRVLHQYSLKKNQAKTMQLKQFPIVLAHAVTAHKMQGQTSQKPLRVSMNVAECFDEAQGYVMLSRVQSLDQVVIRESQKLKKDMEIRKKNDLEGADWKKYLRTSVKAGTELKKMNQRSLNANPDPYAWMWFEAEVIDEPEEPETES